MSNGASGIIAARPNLLWSATTITLRDTSIILRSGATTSGVVIAETRFGHTAHAHDEHIRAGLR